MIGAYIGIILIVTGAVTATMLAQFVAPSPVLSLIFGEAPMDRVTLFLARHWGLLIFCVGILLIYAAYHPAIRTPIMVFAVTEKVALGASILGTSLRAHPVAAMLAVGDLGIALVYAIYLAGL